MVGLGTIINVAGIIGGGIIGLLFGKLMNQRLQETLIKAVGLCVMFIGASGALQEIFIIENGKLQTQGTMMMIVCFALGSLLGEILNIDAFFEKLGEWLKRKTGSTGEKNRAFVEGFVSASVTVCVGAMAIVGSIKDGIYGDYSILAVKTLLDVIIVTVMTASMGKGCIFSAIPVAVVQGTFTALAKAIEPVLTDAALSNLSLTGSMLIACIGINQVFGNRLKVANMLPTIFFAVIWAFIPFLN